MPTTRNALCVPVLSVCGWLTQLPRGGRGRDGTGGHRTGASGRLKLLYVEGRGTQAYKGSACSGNPYARRCHGKWKALSPRELLG